MNASSFLRTLVLGFLLALPAAAAGEGWEPELDKALAQAKQENKPVLVEFTGSDWCPPCIMMNKKVFSKDEFVSKASEKFVLAVVDIPNKDPELKEKNMPLLEKYEVEGVPTVVLLDSAGKEFHRFGASQYPDVEKFLAHLDEALEKRDMD